MGNSETFSLYLKLSELLLKYFWFVIKISLFIMPGVCIMMLVTSTFDMRMLDWQFYFNSALFSGALFLIISVIVKDFKKGMIYYAIIGLFLAFCLSAYINFFLQR